MKILWFKKDLRIYDHKPFESLFNDLKLENKTPEETVIPLYVFEPEMWNKSDYSLRHYQFLVESLSELNCQLGSIGTNLLFRIGDIQSILYSLNKIEAITTIYSHQETGNMWSYKRDIELAKWVKKNSINWNQYQQNGVIRGAKDREDWPKKWMGYMTDTVKEVGYKFNIHNMKSDHFEEAKKYVKNVLPFNQIQKGGRESGLELLNTFLEYRSKQYSKELSSPVTAFESCSRLSPYFSFGCMSVREVYQAIQNKIKQLDEDKVDGRTIWKRSLRACVNRLKWHCHFIQKLEMQPEIEFKNLHPLTETIKRSENKDHFEKWKAGETGFTIADASMRALKSTGWINFRMRAMLVSLATHHLNLPWQSVAGFLSQCFTDYEPGIHYSQCQMQAGTTGINAIRIYNPIKQAKDHDPKGVFIREWIPELRELPSEYVANPEEFPLIQTQYTAPIVDEKIARKEAASRLYSLRKSSRFRSLSEEIVNKHAVKRIKRNSK